MAALARRGAIFTDIVLEIFRLNRLLLDAGDLVAAPAGLTSARWQVMGVVEHGPTSVSNVARTMGLTRQSVQETANGLARDRFVAWIDNPRDRRARLLTLTRKGRRAMTVLVERHAEWANAAGGRHGQPSLRTMLDLLRALRATLEAS